MPIIDKFLLNAYLDSKPFNRLVMAIRNPELRGVAKEDDDLLDLEIGDLTRIASLWSFFKDKNDPEVQLCLMDKDWMMYRKLKGRIILKLLK